MYALLADEKRRAKLLRCIPEWERTARDNAFLKHFQMKERVHKMVHRDSSAFNPRALPLKSPFKKQHAETASSPRKPTVRATLKDTFSLREVSTSQ